MEEVRNNASCILACIVRSVAGLSLALCVLLSSCLQHQEVGTVNSSAGTSDSSRAIELLAELNHLEDSYGNRKRNDPDYDVPGEAIAKIDFLKEQLERLGYSVLWDRDVYILRDKEATDTDPGDSKE